MQRRRERGLCFNCDDKFTPGHRCKIKHAFLIEHVETDDEGDLGKETEIEDAEISVHAMADVNGPQTMRLGSWIRDWRVVVLIDNGSSHNFINQEIARKLNLNATTVEPSRLKWPVEIG